MAKKLTPDGYRRHLAARIEDRAQQHSHAARHVAVFLALKPVIQAALEAGFRQRTIWEDLTDAGSVGCTYQTFNRHVRRYILSAGKSSKDEPDKDNKKESRQDAMAPERRDPLSGFQVRARPRKEDLV